MPTLSEKFAYFNQIQTGEHESFEPSSLALANWGTDRLQGPAITGLLARAAEKRAQLEAPEFVPARASMELFRVVAASPTSVRTEVVRKGSRILVVDAFLMQHDEIVARAHTYFFRPGVSPNENIWVPEQELVPPDASVPADERGRSYRSDGTQWSAYPLNVTRPTRKFVWQSDIRTVAGETPTGFERVCAAADLASMTVHWGHSGVQYINTDVSLSISRTPKGEGVGVAALDWSSFSGVSAGTATLFDVDGALGIVLLSGLAQSQMRVDFVPEGFSLRRIP